MNNLNSLRLRIVAVSATVPNAEDVAAWLGDHEHPATHYKYVKPITLSCVAKASYICIHSYLLLYHFCSIYLFSTMIVLDYIASMSVLCVVDWRRPCDQCNYGGWCLAIPAPRPGQNSDLTSHSPINYSLSLLLTVTINLHWWGTNNSFVSI